ncbi:metallophosphoesterase family protein [Pseudomonas borbori]|uniref:Calcineurin-like phosphoesterase n=1 Tax=Pseudomonas borbori TaxID=289003 RepID=A0A1I5LCA8_9PSED|nr:Calcineurin-like phosphoesterase [Pseudomonas borbori]
MRIHLLSDLHLEFSVYAPQVEDADVVILAGDIDVKARGVDWARQAFRGHVLYVPGNHEFYGGHLIRTLLKMRSMADERVRVLDRDEVLVGDVRFLGCTMWTDYACTGNAHLAAWHARTTMNDFRKIRTEPFENLAECMQVAFDAGAKRILLPMASVTDIPTVPGEPFAKFQTGFYSDPVDAAFKALGVS